LTYAYKSTSSNQLLKVTDSPNGNDAQGFIDANKTDDYTYDANGNLITDKNKNITAIVYNHLNLPTKITFGTTGNIVYIYNAAGQKLEKLVTIGVSPVVKTQYLGGFQYKDNVLQFFPTAEGYVKNTNGIYSYVFNYTDHLGNVRLSYSDTSKNGLIETTEIVDESHYYPFGLKHSGYVAGIPDPNYKYKYQGQERQDELGLNVDSYKYRNYDYAIGRFFNMDRFSEKYTPISPYSHVANNPLKYIEIQGDSIQLIIGRPYKLNGEDHPYGHVALRVYNSKEGYDYVYDFGRYGAVRGMFGQTGDGILNIYDDSVAYFKTEQSIRESIGYSEGSTVAEDRRIIDYYNKLAATGSRYKKGDRSHRKSFKLPDDYDITDNNCCTVSADGLGLIGENWIGDEYDPRDALSFLENNYKKLGLTRTVYKVGGITVTTYAPKPPKPKPEPKKEEKKKEEKKKK
jgi:RHS repeat-associated protein